MTTYIETRVISLNSESADIYKNGTYLSDMVFGFLGLLKDEADILHKQITLANAQIPVSFYIVNYTNNVFVFITNPLGVPVYTTITIPVGNYNSTTLITALYYAILPTGLSMLITISKLTGVLTFSSTSNYGFRSTSVLTTANQILGLNKASDLIASMDINGNWIATLPFPCNLLGIKQLQVRSSILSMNNFSSNSRGQNTLLATIPVDSGAWGMINFLDTTGNNITFNNTTLDEIDIQIVDAETGKTINFWNSNWTMTLIIHLTRSIQIPSMNRSLASISEPLNTNGFSSVVPLSEASFLKQSDGLPKGLKPLAKSETSRILKTKDEEELDFLKQ
jgi:hypothetical protein